MAPKLSHEEASEVMLAARLLPLESYVGSDKRWKCRCMTCSEVVTPSRMNVLQGHQGCGYCAGTLITEADAVSAMRSAGFEPLEPYYAKKTPWRCKCVACGTVLDRQLSAILQDRGGCPSCSGLLVDAESARQVMVAAGFEPLEPFAMSTKGWRSRCLGCSEEVYPTYTNAKRGTAKCRWCAGLAVSPDEAVSVMRALGLEPVAEYVNSRTPWDCVCVQCSRVVSPRYSDAVQGRTRCAFCAGARVDPDEAVEVMRAAGFEPLEPYRDSKAKWECRCLACGEVSAPSYGNVRTGSRCRFCAQGGGYNPSKAGWLYVLVDDIDYSVRGRKAWCGTATQYGITNSLDERLRDHRRTGFTAAPVFTIQHNNGWLIASLESAIGSALAGGGVIPCAVRGDRGFPGSNESFGSEQLPIGEFITLVESLYADLLAAVSRAA